MPTYTNNFENMIFEIAARNYFRLASYRDSM